MGVDTLFHDSKVSLFFFCKNSKVFLSKTHDLITFTIPASALISIKLFKVSGIFIIELSVLDVVT